MRAAEAESRAELASRDHAAYADEVQGENRQLHRALEVAQAARISAEETVQRNLEAAAQAKLQAMQHRAPRCPRIIASYPR